MSPDEFEKYLTAEEAAAALLDKGVEVAPRTLCDKARARLVPSKKVNRRLKFRLTELLAYYNSGDLKKAN